MFPFFAVLSPPCPENFTLELGQERLELGICSPDGSGPLTGSGHPEQED